MEIMMRCALPDRPGALAELAGVIGSCGADIGSVEVVDTDEGTALDDLVLLVRGPEHLRELLAAIGKHRDIEVVHTSLSRGRPGDAVTRFAVGLEAILSGAMPLERGIVTLLGGLLRATEVEITETAPPEAPGRMVLAMATRHVVLHRPYPFSPTERGRAQALLRVCNAADRPTPPAG